MASNISSCFINLPNADSPFITEHHFNPVIHSPWLLFFGPLKPCFFCLGVHDVFCLAFPCIDPISFSTFLAIQSDIDSNLHPCVPHLCCWAFSVFETYCIKVSMFVLWYLTFTIFPFYLYLVQSLDLADHEQPTSFATIGDDLPSWRSFTILSFLSTDTSHVGAMIHASLLGATVLQGMSSFILTAD